MGVVNACLISADRRKEHVPDGGMNFPVFEGLTLVRQNQHQELRTVADYIQQLLLTLEIEASEREVISSQVIRPLEAGTPVDTVISQLRRSEGLSEAVVTSLIAIIIAQLDSVNPPQLIDTFESMQDISRVLETAKRLLLLENRFDVTPEELEGMEIEGPFSTRKFLAESDPQATIEDPVYEAVLQDGKRFQIGFLQNTGEKIGAGVAPAAHYGYGGQQVVSTILGSKNPESLAKGEAYINFGVAGGSKVNPSMVGKSLESDVLTVIAQTSDTDKGKEKRVHATVFTADGEIICTLDDLTVVAANPGKIIRLGKRLGHITDLAEQKKVLQEKIETLGEETERTSIRLPCFGKHGEIHMKVRQNSKTSVKAYSAPPYELVAYGHMFPQPGEVPRFREINGALFYEDTQGLFTEEDFAENEIRMDDQTRLIPEGMVRNHPKMNQRRMGAINYVLLMLERIAQDIMIKQHPEYKDSNTLPSLMGLSFDPVENFYLPSDVLQVEVNQKGDNTFEASAHYVDAKTGDLKRITQNIQLEMGAVEDFIGEPWHNDLQAHAFEHQEKLLREREHLSQMHTTIGQQVTDALPYCSTDLKAYDSPNTVSENEAKIIRKPGNGTTILFDRNEIPDTKPDYSINILDIGSGQKANMIHLFLKNLDQQLAGKTAEVNIVVTEVSDDIAARSKKSLEGYFSKYPNIHLGKMLFITGSSVSDSTAEIEENIGKIDVATANFSLMYTDLPNEMEGCSQVMAPHGSFSVGMVDSAHDAVYADANILEAKVNGKSGVPIHDRRIMEGVVWRYIQAREVLGNNDVYYVSPQEFRNMLAERNIPLIIADVNEGSHEVSHIYRFKPQQLQ